MNWRNFMDYYQHRRHKLQGIIRTDTKQVLYEICRQNHWYIKRMETDKDHIHILLQYNPTDSITNIVHVLKQHSTWKLWKIHSHFLKKYYWKNRVFWSDGYFAASIGQVSQSTIEHYIENQG